MGTPKYPLPQFKLGTGLHILTVRHDAGCPAIDSQNERLCTCSAVDITMARPFAALALSPRSPSSYALTGGTPDTLRATLVQRGWRATPRRSEHEHSRLVQADGLIVVYTSGAVVTQGADQPRAHRALAQWVEGGKK